MCVCVCVFSIFLSIQGKQLVSSVVLDPPPDIHCIEKHTSLWFEKERKPHTFVSFIYVG